MKLRSNTHTCTKTKWKWNVVLVIRYLLIWMSPHNDFLSIFLPFFSLFSPSVSLSLSFRLPALTPGVVSRKTIFTLMCVSAYECARYLLCVERSCVGAWKVWVECLHMHVCVHCTHECTPPLLCVSCCMWCCYVRYINMQYVCYICPCTYVLFICSHTVRVYEVYNSLETESLLGTCYLYPADLGNTISGANATRRTYINCASFRGWIIKRMPCTKPGPTRT